jgi:hypothetical protein
LSVPAFAQTIYASGPINGNNTGLFVTGPNAPNFKGVQDISDRFVAAISGSATALDWGEWSVDRSTSFPGRYR